MDEFLFNLDVGKGVLTITQNPEAVETRLINLTPEK